MSSEITMMSPEDILVYVARALGSISKQLDDYKRHAEKKQEKAADLNKALAYVRDANAGGGGGGKFTPEQYNEMMPILAKYKEHDPNIKAAYETFLSSYKRYADPATGEWIKADPANSPNGILENEELNESEWKSVTDNLTSALETLNSDNEYTMMKLQNLMQQRNQVSQFASNMLNLLHESNKAIIGNLRA